MIRGSDIAIILGVLVLAAIVFGGGLALLAWVGDAIMQAWSH